MPMPATHHAMIAPRGLGARAKLRDSEKMPAPTIYPTTIAVNSGRESFGSVSDAIAHPPLRKRKSMRKDTDANAHYNLPPCCGGGRAAHVAHWNPTRYRETTALAGAGPAGRCWVLAAG
jgi:hypothetical protein